ncbi:MAG: DUF456 domain-containing protein [Proteobacteria bacterium]|nr:DUF456 domain-containing protein [Pseudomonadota bacterium]MBU1594452.1 DUF456 domain-containing protein [Pseudomonadota bacterium]
MDLLWGLCLGLILFCFLWLNLLSLPGNWLMLGVLCLAAWLGPEGRITWAFVGLMGAAAVLGEVLELAAQLIGGKRGGASGVGNFGGIVGSIAGAILLAPFALGLGSLVGALFGAWVGCFTVELMRQETRQRAAEAAWGAFWGRSFGLAAKSAVGATIIIMSIQRFVA